MIEMARFTVKFPSHSVSEPSESPIQVLALPQQVLRLQDALRPFEPALADPVGLIHRRVQLLA